MLGPGRKASFDPDTLSSIWVLACRDESPVLTTYSIAYRLGDITPEEVLELVKGRRELFRLGLTPGQSRHWKERYRQAQDGEQEPPEEGEEPKRPGLPDWLRVFDDEGSDKDQKRVRGWLHDEGVTTSRQALDRFLDKGFVIDESVVRSRFRDDHELKAEPSDLATVNWGLEHIERLRRGRAETRQHWIALTTGIGGVAIGALVALTAPMITTLYQGRPLDTNRLTFDHQTRLVSLGELGAATAKARRAARAGDGNAVAEAVIEVERAATMLGPLLDEGARQGLRAGQAGVVEACATATAGPGCGGALEEMRRLLDGPLAEAAAR